MRTALDIAMHEFLKNWTPFIPMNMCQQFGQEFGLVVVEAVTDSPPGLAKITAENLVKESRDD
jgi:hypothetical protein